MTWKRTNLWISDSETLIQIFDICENVVIQSSCISLLVTVTNNFSKGIRFKSDGTLNCFICYKLNNLNSLIITGESKVFELCYLLIGLALRHHCIVFLLDGTSNELELELNL